MIEIYLKTNTNYDKNGDITLDPTSCTYKDIENLLTLEHFIDDEGRWKYINFENVIAVEENGKKKLYRIYNVVRSLYNVTAYARPIFYDLIDKVLIDVRPTNKLGKEALNIVLEDTGFTGHSNLTTLSTSYYIRKNIVEALLGDNENSFLNRWGGEFYCENFDVYINDRIGSDNGVRVEFGYNLNEIEEDVNIEEVVTRIIPVGFDEIMLEGNTPWVDSPLINKYTHIKMRVIKFSDVKVKESSEDEEGFDTIEEARTELIKQCKILFEEGIDKPIVNYKIDMINIANTTAYEGLEMLVNVNKGDVVTCYIPHLDIDVKARVIDYEKDLLIDQYISLEIGNVIDNFFNQQADIQATVNKITNSNGSVNAGEIQGVINAIQTQFKALRDIAQPQDVRAILFEDKVEDSPTFGCMCLGTIGFEIASKFKPGTQEWDFRTFGTGQGFIADCIIAGILMSRNGISWLNLDNGTFNFADKITYDGNNLNINLEGQNIPGLDDANEAAQNAITIAASKVSFTDLSGLGKTEINGGNVTTGTLKSFNGKSWLNLEDGSFDFANGNLSFDGLNMQMIGKIINVLNGIGIELSQGGLKIVTQGENLGGIRGTYFAANEKINGINLTTLRDGDYIDISSTENEDFAGQVKYSTKFRVAMVENELMNNFKGIQLLDNVMLKNGKIFKMESTDSNKENWHEVYNSTGGYLCEFGDNGILLGYKSGSERVTAIDISEFPNQYGSQIKIHKQISLLNNNITSVNDIYRHADSGRYFHDGWCGSIESTAKRISNLNVFLDSGWYGFGAGANGAPVTWGVMLHLKLSSNDFSQLVMGTDNKIYTRWWVNNTWTAWLQR